MATVKLGKDTRCANCGRFLCKGEEVFVKGGVGKSVGLGAVNLMLNSGSTLGDFYCCKNCLNEATGGNPTVGKTAAKKAGKGILKLYGGMLKGMGDVLTNMVNSNSSDTSEEEQ